MLLTSHMTSRRSVPHIPSYTVSQKNVHLFIFELTLSKINQF